MPMTLGCTTQSKSGFKGLEPLPKTATSTSSSPIYGDIFVNSGAYQGNTTISAHSILCSIWRGVWDIATFRTDSKQIAVGTASGNDNSYDKQRQQLTATATDSDSNSDSNSDNNSDSDSSSERQQQEVSDLIFYAATRRWAL